MVAGETSLGKWESAVRATRFSLSPAPLASLCQALPRGGCPAVLGFLSPQVVPWDSAPPAPAGKQLAPAAPVQAQGRL